jgi:hypothetical protein
MPSESNHSPGSRAVSSAGFSPGENTGDSGLLSVLIAQSERAADLLLEVEADPRRQAAQAELAAQSDRAASFLIAQQQVTVGLLSQGETP